MYYPENSHPSTRINWRPNAVCPFESAWSYVHKFLYLNAPTLKEAKRFFFGTTFVTHWNLLHWPKPLAPQAVRALSLSPARLASMVGGGFTNEPYMHSLRYCPECLANGFHTTLFHASFVARCPIHDIPLRLGCISCGTPVPLELTAGSLAIPYGCPSCGHIFWPSRDADTWKLALTRADIRLLGAYRLWKRRTERNSLALTPSPPPQPWIEQTYSSPAITGSDEIVRLLYRKPENDERHLSYTASNHVAIHFTVPLGSVCRIRLPSTVFIESLSHKTTASAWRTDSAQILVGVHKSIRRFLKRTFLAKHSECVRLQRGIDTIPCPVARAFIAWDRAWSSLIPDWDQFERDGFFNLRNAVPIEKDGYIGSEGTKILLREGLIRRRLFAQALLETFFSAWELSNTPIVAVRGNEIGWPAMVLSPPENHSRVSTLWLCRRDFQSATRIIETANKIGGASHTAQVVEEAKRHIELHRQLLRKMVREGGASDDS